MAFGPDGLACASGNHADLSGGAAARQKVGRREGSRIRFRNALGPGPHGRRGSRVPPDCRSKVDPPFRKAKLEQLEQNRESGSTEFKITIAL